MEDFSYNDPEIMNAIKEDTNNKKEITRNILRKYFIKAKSTEAEYYYNDGSKKICYNIIKEKRDEFEEELRELAKKHIKVNIKMIDKRTEEFKMMMILTGGHYMKDLNFTAFDLGNNLMLRKYDHDLEQFRKDLHSCGSYEIFTRSQIVKDESIMREKANRVKKLAGELCKTLDKRDKEDLMEIRYHPDIGIDHDNCIHRCCIYIGCEVSLETDVSWFNFYKR